MKAKAIVQLRFSTERDREIVAKSLEPEIRKPITPRSKATTESKSKLLILRVEANDTIALRSALNAYLRWINSIMNVLSIMEKQFS